MACEKCISAGKTKIISFERCGRWETRIYCDHSYKEAKLSKAETTHVISRHEAGKAKKQARRSPVMSGRAKINYTEDMDRFIALNYSGKRGRNSYGTGYMKTLRKGFTEKFGVPVTASQIIGRWNRIKEIYGGKLVERSVPSLPVLKFMQREV